MCRISSEVSIAGGLPGECWECWGAKSLWEVLRWELAVNSNAPVSDYKLNNNYTSRYARKLMAEDKEEWGDFFQLRRLKG